MREVGVVSLFILSISVYSLQELITLTARLRYLILTEAPIKISKCLIDSYDETVGEDNAGNYNLNGNQVMLQPVSLQAKQQRWPDKAT